MRAASLSPPQRDFRDTAPKIKAETELQDLNPGMGIGIVGCAGMTFNWYHFGSLRGCGFQSCDLFVDDVRLPVPVEDFEGHVKKMHANTDHLFSEEYEVIGHVTITWESHELSCKLSTPDHPDQVAESATHPVFDAVQRQQE